jgi:hypothetical protein
MPIDQNDILQWIHPTGAHIIDALLFTQPSEVEDGVLERHRQFIASLHDKHLIPAIEYPQWYITMREPGHYFMVSYPFGCNRSQPYNVRLCIEEVIEFPPKSNVYKMSMDIRYNRAVTGNRKYHTLVTDRYEKALDFVSLCASAQSTFHTFFKEQTDDPCFLMNTKLYDSVSDYSCQPSILPAYNTHQTTKGLRA